MIYDCKPDNPLYEIVQKLRVYRLDSLEESLERAILEEQEALLGYDRTRRRTRKREKEAGIWACENYATLIKGFLEDPAYMITSGDILCYRCKATAWAIARRITDEEIYGRR